MIKLRWTLAALGTLGATAAADPGQPVPVTMGAETAVAAYGSSRGVAEDYLVLPSGGELTGQLRFVTAEPVLGAEPIRFTDLALFGLAGRWSLFGKLEVSAQADFLPKQPTYTDEKPWQSVGFGLRSPLGKHVAIAVSGGGGHLIAHTGAWTRESLAIEWKKPIDPQFLAFDIQGGIDGVGLTAPNVSQGAFLTELALQTSALFREPSGHWGAWVGVAYAVPVQHSGADPTTGVAIDPHARLDFHIGTVLSLVKAWDLFVDFAVINRGDPSRPATELPILDGGFDQRQVVFGVTRHIEAPRPRHHDNDDALRLGSL